MDSACPWSSGVSTRSDRYASTRARSSSGFRIAVTLRRAFCPLELVLDLLAQPRELAEDVECPVCVVCLRQTLELRAGRFEPGQQLFCAGERVLGARHAAFSRRIRPRMPFTSRPASSVA